jgi:hypothetical protein
MNFLCRIGNTLAAGYTVPVDNINSTHQDAWLLSTPWTVLVDGRLVSIVILADIVTGISKAPLSAHSVGVVDSTWFEEGQSSSRQLLLLLLLLLLL